MLNRSSNALRTWVVVGVGALVLALSAFFILSNFSPDSTYAQTPTGTIEYAENGMAPVRTFSSEDPEGAGIHWDVTGIDADDFEISGGVLTFKNPPDYEKPTDRVHGALDRNRDGDTDDTANGVDVVAADAADNMYRITIRASEVRESGYTGRALSTESHVTVMVTNKNESGMVTMNRIQPEVGTPITAMINDPDGTDGNGTVTWAWSVSKVTNPVADAANHWSTATGSNPTTDTYTPAGTRPAGVTTYIPGTNTNNAAVDETKFLRATATYTDSLGGQSRTVYGVSEHAVRAEVSSDSDTGVTNPANGSPGFRQGVDYTRTVREDRGKGMNVGAPVTATDPNTDTLTYELDDDAVATNAMVLVDTNNNNAPTDVSFFSVDRTNGQIKVKNTLDYDNKGTGADQGKYTFYVRAIDPSGETAEVEVTVIATDANDAPKIMGSIATGTPPGAPSEVRVLEQDSDDRSTPEGPDATYYGTSNGEMNPTDGTPAMGLPVALALGNQNVFTVSDEDERGQRTWTLRGDDAADFVLTQGGTQEGGTEGALTGPNEPIALVFINPPDYEMPADANGDSVYKVVLVATDTAGAEDTRPMTIFVDNIAEQGKVTLSVEQPFIGTEITAMVDDPDNGDVVVTWQWSRNGYDGDTDLAVYEVINGATSSTYTPMDDDDGAFLRVTATYIDTTSDMDMLSTGTLDERVQKGTPADPIAKVPHTGDGVTDPVTDEPASPIPDKIFRVMATSANAVRVEPGTPGVTMDPEFSATSYERTVAENAEVGSIVGVPIQVDMETGVTFGYDLDATETNDNNYFTIDDYGQIRVGEVAFPNPLSPEVIDDVPSGTTVFKDDPTLDFEVDNSFQLIVTATDMEEDTRTATTRVTVRLKDLNESPVFDKESRDRVMNADGATIPIVYAESRTNAVVPLAAMEPDGDDLRWEVTGADAASFMIMDAADIASDGKDRVELHFKADKRPDFETRGGDAADNPYNVIVRAVETTALNDGPRKSAELPVTVHVTNVDEAGTVDIRWLQPEVGTAISASVTDLDGEVQNPSWTWYRSKLGNPNRNPGSMESDLTAQWEQITTATTASYTPQGNDAATPDAEVAVDENLFLLARVTYTDPHDAGKAAVAVTANAVRADVADGDNNSPDFTANTTNRTVREDAAIGAAVGAQVKVDVNEDSDILTYELDNDNDDTTQLPTGDELAASAVSYFSIDKANGQILVAKKLDFDNNPPLPDDADGKYTVWVRAWDSSGEETNNENWDQIEVTITASNVNEAPRVVDGLAEISINEVNSTAEDDDATKFVGLGYELTTADPPVQQMDTDNNPNLYHRADEDRVDAGRWPDTPIGGADGRLFEYSVPDDGIGRRLHFKKTDLPDYENPMDHNKDNVYEVSVVVRDNGNLTGMKNVRITVMNVNEDPTLTLTPEQPDDGMAVMAMLTDPDGVEYITDWAWAETGSRATEFPTGDTDPNDNVDDFLVLGATTNEHIGAVGNFVWAMVDYRDGYSMENDPVTALDERNDDPITENVTETYKLPTTQGDENDTAVDDNLIHNSDHTKSKGTDNAVRTDPDQDDDIPAPSTNPVLVNRMVYESVPSTGYVGIPLDITGEMGLQYKETDGDIEMRDTIGGPDGASFEFAEDMDRVADDYYDGILAPGTDEQSDPIDKAGQLAAAVVTHFDYEGDKNEYIIEVTDPDAEVAVGPVRVTITVMDVNEAPSAPAEQKGGLSITGRDNVLFDEIVDDASPNLMIGTYRGIGADAANARWSISGADAGDFSINASTGELTLRAAPDFENPADEDTNNEYLLTVEANDGSNQATLPVNVTVRNVNEEGRVTFWRDGVDATTSAIMVGDVLTGLAEDPDGAVGATPPITDMYPDISSATWQWARTMTPPANNWEDIIGADMAEYTVDAADAGYYLRATATYDDAQGAGKDAEMATRGAVDAVVTTPDDDLIAMYDGVANGGNGDGIVQKLEYLAALDDFLDEIIDRDDLLTVLDALIDALS